MIERVVSVNMFILAPTFESKYSSAQMKHCICTQMRIHELAYAYELAAHLRIHTRINLSLAIRNSRLNSNKDYGPTSHLITAMIKGLHSI